ncbi:uncharacterized protein LOC113748378 [Larimichthys crocea]|uniref:uncharacterized protein LOC113748378 n=1 Tax=Larimichthys crocea TaxID=215358 RepID=UPI000F5F594F|nr:uncharacterized protein LOC113748378 [Larimichthys crocea]
MSRRTPPSSSPMPVQRQQPGQVIPGEGSSTSDPQGCQNLACKRQKKEASAQIKRLRKLQAQHQPSSSSEDQEEPQQQPQPQKKQPWPSEGPDGQPGYQHVLKLATALVEVRSLQGLSDTAHCSGITCQSRTSSESSTLPDRERRERLHRGRTPPVLGRRVSSAACSDRPRALQAGPAPAAWWRPFTASSGVFTSQPHCLEGPQGLGGPSSSPTTWLLERQCWPARG